MGVFILEKDITFMFIRRNFDMQFRVHADKMLLYIPIHVRGTSYASIYQYTILDGLNGFVNSCHVKHIMERNAIFDVKIIFHCSC